MCKWCTQLLIWLAQPTFILMSKSCTSVTSTLISVGFHTSCLHVMAQRWDCIIHQLLNISRTPPRKNGCSNLSVSRRLKSTSSTDKSGNSLIGELKNITPVQENSGNRPELIETQLDHTLHDIEENLTVRSIESTDALLTDMLFSSFLSWPSSQSFYTPDSNVKDSGFKKLSPPAQPFQSKSTGTVSMLNLTQSSWNLLSHKILFILHMDMKLLDSTDGIPFVISHAPQEE